MENGKKLIALLLCVCMVLPLFGCGKKEEIQLPETFMPEDLSLSEEDVVFEENTLYADSQILLTAKDGTAYETVEKLVQKEGGEIIGFINFSQDYHVDFPEGKTYEELNALLQQWGEKSFVEAVSLNQVFSLTCNSVNYKDDPWVNTSPGANTKQNPDWSELNPDGDNWWAEAIRMPSVWNMDIWDTGSYYPVKIGIIDSVFDETHQDLDEVFAKLWNNNEGWNKLANSTANTPEEKALLKQMKRHGTHIAGIIAAEMGNGAAIAGVASCASPELYGFSWEGKNQKNFGEVFVDLIGYKYAIALMLESGVKVISISMGDDAQIVAAQNGVESAKRDLEKYVGCMTSFLKKAIRGGYDFLIIKSAGNASYYSWTTCQVSKDNPYGYKIADAQKGETGTKAVYSACYDFLGAITDPEVKDHLIIVGAAEQNKISSSGYVRAELSNTDSDVYAPGVEILSTVPGYEETDCCSGTSQATPIVAGIAGLIWSVNPELAAKQVKSIILESASAKATGESVLKQTEADEVYIVNSAFAVKQALVLKGSSDSTKSSDGVIMGTVYTEIADSNGIVSYDAITNANIFFAASDNTKTESSGLITDELGSFDAFLPSGEYKLTVEASGYEDYETTVSVKEGEVAYLSVLMTRARSAKKQPKQMYFYMYGELQEIHTFRYDEKQQLIGVYVDDLAFGETADCTFVYDEAGRLIQADNEHLGYGEEYTYNDSGQLVSYKYYSYWNGVVEFPQFQIDYEYDEEGREISETEFYGIYDTSTGSGYLEEHSKSDSYLYDDQGRVTEKHGSEYDGVNTPLDDYVTKYAYDLEGRIVSEETFYSAYAGVSAPFTYSYAYDPIVVVSSPNITKLMITDTVGNPVWFFELDTCELTETAEGYFTNTHIGGDYIIQFIYDDPTGGGENTTAAEDRENTINALNALLIGVKYYFGESISAVSEWTDEMVCDAIGSKLLWNGYQNSDSGGYQFSDQSWLSGTEIDHWTVRDRYWSFDLEAIQKLTRDTLGRDFPLEKQLDWVYASGDELLLDLLVGESTTLAVQNYTKQGDKLIAVGTAVHNYNAFSDFLGYFQAVFRENPSSIYGYTLISLSPIGGNQRFDHVTAEASSVLKEPNITHYAENAVDGDLKTAWVESADGVGINEWIELKTEDGAKMEISAIEFGLGYQKSDQLLEKNGWPRKVLIECENGYQQTAEFYYHAVDTVLLDQPVTTSWVKITILDAVAGTVYEDTCISEIRFYGIDSTAYFAEIDQEDLS